VDGCERGTYDGLEFTGTIQRNSGVANSSAWIELPHDLKESYGVGNLVPFTAVFDGWVSYRGGLAKMGGEHAMILLRKDVRAELGKSPVDSVDVVVELDEKPRELEVPVDLRQALASADALERFEGLAYTHRKEYVRWVEEAKRPETRTRRIASTCEMVAEGRTRSR
jgi:hypothetical protein